MFKGLYFLWVPGVNINLTSAAHKVKAPIAAWTRYWLLTIRTVTAESDIHGYFKCGNNKRATILYHNSLFQMLQIPSINGFLTVIQEKKAELCCGSQQLWKKHTQKAKISYSRCGKHNSTPHKHWTIPVFWPGCRVLPCPGHHWLRITINSTCQHCRLPDICCGIDLCLPNPNGGEDWNRDKHLPPWWKTEMRYVQNGRGSAATISEHLF